MSSLGELSFGRAAAGEQPNVEQIPEETAEPAADEDMLTHTYNLRTDTQVTFEFPSDLTQNEAERLVNFIRTLPIEEEA